MPDVFVSYSRDDQLVARRFAEGFEREGLSVWWDQALNPGEAFDRVTEKALEDARAVVVLWSKRSVESSWVRAEATQARAAGRLVPVMIEPCKRPILFELTHTADLSDWEGDPDDPAWQGLVAGVRRFVQGEVSPAPATPTPSVIRAAPKKPDLARRRTLIYGASAVGAAAAGFAAGALLTGRGPAPELPGVPTFQRLTFRRGLIRSGRLASDGQSILYGALWDGDVCRVHSTRIDNPESRPLDLPNANLLAVSKSGDLAVSVGPQLEGVVTYGTLARVPIAGGAPRELAERVRFADWSPDGAELAVIRNVDGNDRLEYPLGKVLFQSGPDEGGILGFVRIAPDARRLAFVQYTRGEGNVAGRLCVVDLDGKHQVISEEFLNIHGLAWRGDEIWFTATEDRPLFRAFQAIKPGAKPRIVARMPVNVTLWDASEDRMLIAQTDDRAAMFARVRGETHDRELSWLDATNVVDLSRDGRMVLFAEFGQGVRAIPAAYLRGIDGSPPVKLGDGSPLALSPDARWALINTLKPGEASAHVELVPTGAGESRRLALGTLQCSGARWLPDGKSVLILAAEQGKPPRLLVMELPEGRPRPVTSEGVRALAVSPDGSKVATLGIRPGIAVDRVNGGEGQAVPQSGDVRRLWGWINDGLLVMYAEPPDSPRGDVYLLDPVSGRKRLWGNVLPRDGAGIMNLGRVSVTTDGGTIVVSWHRALSNLYLAQGLV